MGLGTKIPSSNKSVDLLSTGIIATVKAVKWTGGGPYTNSVVVTGLKSTDNPVIHIAAGYNENMCSAYMLVAKAETQDGTLILTSNTKPTIDFKILIKN